MNSVSILDIENHRRLSLLPSKQSKAISYKIIISNKLTRVKERKKLIDIDMHFIGKNRPLTTFLPAVSI